MNVLVIDKSMVSCSITVSVCKRAAKRLRYGIEVKNICSAEQLNDELIRWTDIIIAEFSLDDLTNYCNISRLSNEGRLSDIEIAYVTNDSYYTYKALIDSGACRVMNKPIGIDDAIHCMQYNTFMSKIRQSEFTNSSCCNDIEAYSV